jgi:hypothetical protein
MELLFDLYEEYPIASGFVAIGVILVLGYCIIKDLKNTPE